MVTATYPQTILLFDGPNEYSKRLFGQSSLQEAQQASSALPESTTEWLAKLFPAFVSSPFGDHHIALWNWIDAIPPDSRPPAFVGVWPRGGAKSTSAELACVRLGALKQRRYGLYVSGTQDKADKHVETVATLLESPQVAEHYPLLAQRNVGKYGNSKGWRRNRLWTADGFVIDAAGLDKGVRGMKAEDARPDFIILDDIDEHDDSPETTRKNLETLSKAIIPSGNTQNVAILAIQNLVRANGVFDQIVKRKTDLLSRRILSGPIPALDNFSYEIQDGITRITGGLPTWEGLSVETCQAMVEDIGIVSFLAECQHDMDISGDRLVYGKMPNGTLIFDKRRNIKPTPFSWSSCKWRIGGIDQGGRDPTALGVSGISQDERMHRYAELRFNGPMAASAIAEWFYPIHQKAPFDMIVCDPTATALIETLRLDYGLPVYPANNDRVAGVAFMRDMLLTGRLTIGENCPLTVEEMESYWMVERTEGSTSNVSFLTRTPSHHHADLLDELRYEAMAYRDGFPRGQRRAIPIRTWNPRKAS